MKNKNQEQSYWKKHLEEIKRQKEQLENISNKQKKFFSAFDTIFILFFILFIPLIIYYDTLIKIYIMSIGLITIFILRLVVCICLFNRRLKKSKLKESDNPDTAIVIAKFDKFDLYDWLVSTLNYRIDILCKILIKKQWKYKIFFGIKEEELDKIIYDNKYKRIFFLGHGSRDGFKLFKPKKFHYAKFVIDKQNSNLLKKFNQKSIKKKFIAQYHCNGGYGFSLADHIVNKSDREYCDINWKNWNITDLNNHFKKLLKDHKNAFEKI